MIPGLNPKQMRQAMKQMGIKQDEIPATEVIIKTPEKNIVIKNPSVQKMIMQGQESFQVTGEVEEETDKVPEINEEDIEMVMTQANCTKEEAKAAIEICEGDLAQAIIELNEAKNS